MIELRAKDLMFFSDMDEENFINWAESIQSVRESFGELDSIILMVDENCSEGDLREIISLFYRYNVDLRQVSVFKNKYPWINNKKMYWYKKMFH